MPNTKKEKFSLKDKLYNLQKVEQIAREIQAVYTPFDTLGFVEEILEAFPRLELKERMYHIRDMLKKYLPQGYEEAVGILLAALPSELDPSQSDDDFGDFIYAPYGEYVTAYGCEQMHLDFSLQALREISKRFSVEFAIRDFINTYPTQTLSMLEACARSDNYHERRLASEGLRMKLPWAKKLHIDYRLPLTHLELLYSDPTRYVTRSVANHMNDISKIDAPLVVQTLKRWQKSQKQAPKEMAFIIRHALRTLVKQGDEEALAMLGYIPNPPIAIKEIRLNTPEVSIGESLEFELEIEAFEDVNLMVDYRIHFRSKRGTLNPKVHKLKTITLQKGNTIRLKKKHLFKAHMSTRTLYAGEHLWDVQINGAIVSSGSFELKV